MTAKKKTSTGSSVGGQARAAAGRGDTRERVRELTVKALRERGLSRAEVSTVVHDVLHGASEAVENEVPASRESVLRQVFDGLGEAVDTVSEAGARTVKSAKQRGKTVVAANEDFLHAVSTFADRTSSEVGDELRSMVKRARAAGTRAGQSAAGALRAADGRLMELAGETARTGVSVARRAAGEVTMAASGLLQGLGEVIAPRGGGKKTKKTSAKPGAKSKMKKKTKARGR